MARLHRQTVLTLFTYLCLQFVFLAAHTGSVFAQDVVPVTHQEVISPETYDRSEEFGNPTNDHVHKIWSDLRELEPTWKEAVIDSKSSSFAKTAWQYTRLVFRTLFMNSPTRQTSDSDHNSPILSDKLRHVVDELERYSQLQDEDAIFLLAEMNFYGNFTHPRDFQAALRWYTQLADTFGNATAQHMLGLMYATGIGDTVEIDQAKAMLYHTFAAEQGDVKSEMTLAFRYHSGIATGRDCDKAAEYYKRVADKAMDWWLSGPPGGHLIKKNSWRWVEGAGGAYGEGASVSTSGPFAADKGTIYASFDDVLEYLDLRERQGDWQAVLTLGKHFYEAPRGYRRNLRKAKKQFMKIARAYWTIDGKVHPKAPKGIEKTAAKAAAYIGRMFLRGEGMEQNYEKAITWFKRGVANGDAFAQYHLGLMYRDGLGLPKDGSRAAAYFKAAAEQNLGIAQSALGVLFLDQGEIDTASRYFELAASAGVMEGFYYLAELQNQGIGRDRNCHLATTWYKVVAEKAEMLHSAFVEANAAFEREDFDRAFISSLMAAEQGYEFAQANVAYLLDQKTSIISMPSIPLLSNPLESVAKKDRTNLLNNPSLALVYFTRSSKQANVDSLIKVGDYYLSNIGPLNQFNANNSRSSYVEKASTCYTVAAESHHSAQALWNLGWMHENGVGSIEQDFHMAKRYYDLALEMNKEAYLPVKLALVKLRLRSWWNGISGGKVKPMGDDDGNEKDRRPKTFMEWLNRFLDAAEEMDAQEYAALQQQGQEPGHGGDDNDALDGIAYGEPGMPGGDSEYWWGGGNGDGDGEYYGDLDDGLIESLIIISLAGALAMLVYARQQRQRGTREQERRARDEAAAAAAAGGGGAVVPPGQQPLPAAPQPGAVPVAGDQPGPGQNGGFFPHPGDPALPDWAVGGIGH